MCRPGTDSRIILRVCFPKFNYHIITWHLLKLSQMDQVRGQQDPRAAKCVCVSCPPGAEKGGTQPESPPLLCSRGAWGRGTEGSRALRGLWTVCEWLALQGSGLSVTVRKHPPLTISAPRALICVPAVLVHKLLTTCLSPSRRPRLCLVGEPSPTRACMLHCATDLTAS